MKRLFCLVCTVAVLSSSAMAAEISMISGLYQSEKYENNGDDGGGKSAISLGGRFADDLDARLQWFGFTELTLRSFDAPKGGKAPSNSTSLTLGGGIRSYFDPFSQSVAPFLSGYGAFKNERDGEFTLTTTSEEETNGLFYGASVGVRVGMDNTYFLDLECFLFESALFATRTVETRQNSDGTRTEREESVTELYIDTEAPFNSIQVGLGMVL